MPTQKICESCAKFDNEPINGFKMRKLKQSNWPLVFDFPKKQKKNANRKVLSKSQFQSRLAN